MLTLMFPKDPETDELLRQATQWSDDKDLDRAIVCLQQANTRMKVSAVSYSIEAWLRLPLYLQRAGRYDEAMAEFGRISDEAPGRIARAFPHQPKAKQQIFVMQELTVIRKKMCLAQDREDKRKTKQ